MSGRVLILGGTGEARDLAARAQAAGMDVISSLAGRVRDPRLPVGEVRIGGFGGVDGLRTWIGDNMIHAVVDATHPFAAGISSNAAAACAAARVPLLRLERPGWAPAPGADRWHWVGDHDEAAAAIIRGMTVERGSLPSPSGKGASGCWMPTKWVRLSPDQVWPVTSEPFGAVRKRSIRPVAGSPASIWLLP